MTKKERNDYVKKLNIGAGLRNELCDSLDNYLHDRYDRHFEIIDSIYESINQEHIAQLTIKLLENLSTYSKNHIQDILYINEYFKNNEWIDASNLIYYNNKMNTYKKCVKTITQIITSRQVEIDNNYESSDDSYGDSYSDSYSDSYDDSYDDINDDLDDNDSYSDSYDDTNDDSDDNDSYDNSDKGIVKSYIGKTNDPENSLDRHINKNLPRMYLIAFCYGDDTIKKLESELIKHFKSTYPLIFNQNAGGAGRPSKGIQFLYLLTN